MDTEHVRRNAEREIARIAAHSAGSVGVAAEHLGNGAQLAYRAATRFPLASTVKVPLALLVLKMAEAGELRLSDPVDVEPADFAPLSVLGAEFPHPGLSLSVHNLLEVMITHSDNTATDVLFRLVGGPPAVADFVEELGLPNFEVRRTMREALAVLHEIALPSPSVSIREALAEISAAQHDARNRQPGPDGGYRHAERDHGTPADMLAILRAAWQGRIVDAASRDRLIDIMGRTRARERIGGRLPQGVPLANKTGSGRGTSNDVGYLTLAGEAAPVALAIYCKASPLPMEARDRVVADIARLVYDYFVMTAADPDQRPSRPSRRDALRSRRGRPRGRRQPRS
ncbi:serine hydrolase [Acuticoccus mangrovi]|uniref:Beta-lactamase n=1 Tax=Acuticoccus mangrovi TaxID=2796142 RepID=A0A934MEV7_9HYPH|nr:serine hydrolase [Acuticoccus mangrovi]MBJ3777972.1 serine hydrolase [Acuticoccus mangrovi]